MFDHVLDYFNNHTFTEALSAGMVPSILLIAILILVLKILEMSKPNHSGVYKTAAKIVNKQTQAIKNAELQAQLNTEAEEAASIDRLQDEVAMYKGMHEKFNSWSKES
jgi:hypothetical protein